MRPHLILTASSAFIVLLTQATLAAAGPVPTHTTNEAMFFSLATFIESDTIFSPVGPVPDPYTLGSLKLTTGGHNIVLVAGAAPFTPVHDAFASSIHGPIDGAIGDIIHAGPYDLFGFHIGNLVGPDPADLTLSFASGGTFSTVVLSTPIQAAVQFHGFRAPLGDFFTGFTLSAHGIDSRVALTDVFLGTTACSGPSCSSPTPEPAGWALMILGFGVTGAMTRRRRAITRSTTT